MAVIRWTANRTAVSGEDYFLACPYGGYPIVSITWSRNGQVSYFKIIKCFFFSFLVMTISAQLIQDSDKYNQFSNGTLRIASIDPNSDSGEYTCLVRGPSSSTAKRTIYVEVIRN